MGAGIPTVQMGTEIQRHWFPHLCEPESAVSSFCLERRGFIHGPLPTDFGGPSVFEPQFLAYLPTPALEGSAQAP